MDTKFFYGQNEEALSSRTALVRAMGEEHGLELYAIAVKLSHRLNLDEDDVAQEVAKATIKLLRENGGEIVPAYIVNRVKDAIYKTYNYGVNEYYGAQGVKEMSTDAAEDWDGWMESLSAEYGSLVEDDLSEAFLNVYEAITPEMAFVMHSLSQGWSCKEIAEAANKSNSWVTLQKGKLQKAFAYAVA